MNTRADCKSNLLSAVLALALGAGGVIPLAAQAAEAANESDRNSAAELIDFSIAPKSLAAALTDLAEQAGLRFAYSSELTQGLASQGLKGRMSATDALGRLLAGTGLKFRTTGTRTITIEKASGASDTRLLGPVRVEGSGESTGAESFDHGLTGRSVSSSDTITDGTGSYRPRGVTSGGKVAADVMDIPRSISVLTQQRLEDENIVDLEHALQRATGITIGRSYNSITTPVQIRSRGYEISSITTDGGAPAAIRATTTPIDLIGYDHVEVLRGPDGLFAGKGSPGGVINLVRKRPGVLDTTSMALKGGSWDATRFEVDASRALSEDKRIKGRFAAAVDEHEFFYDYASASSSTGYGILTYELSERAEAAIGVEISGATNRGRYLGVPRAIDGNDLNLPASTNYTYPGVIDQNRNQKLFAELNGTMLDWLQGRLSINYENYDSEGHTTQYSIYALDRNTAYDSGRFRSRTYRSEGYSAGVDGTLSGSADLGFTRHRFVMGANLSYVNDYSYQSRDDLSFPLQFPNFNPALVTPRLAAADGAARTVGMRYGIYVQDDVSIGGAFVTIGARHSINDSKAKSFNATGNIASQSTANDPGSIKPYWVAGYRFSDSTQLFYTRAEGYEIQFAQYDVNGDPLEPSTYRNEELGLKMRVERWGTDLSASLYKLDRTDVGTPVIPHRFTCRPTGASQCYERGGTIARSRGADLELVGDLGSDLHFTFGYVLNDNETVSTTKTFSEITPRHSLKAWVDWTPRALGGKWAFGLGAQGQSEHFMSAEYYVIDANGNYVRTEKAEYTQDPFVFFNGRVSYRASKSYELALNVDNLTDERYYEQMGFVIGYNYYGPPRQFTLSLKAKW
ncbi:TonB-dependent siderophore receptor [Steroidobacter flavus]|uniref:TonB-dependent siderophore receptor n=1 Tax=Steroidobacter flavus TaxID=1842136 RepID=A0ABV8SRV3_9GAMM